MDINTIQAIQYFPRNFLNKFRTYMFLCSHVTLFSKQAIEYIHLNSKLNITNKKTLDIEHIGWQMVLIELSLTTVNSNNKNRASLNNITKQKTSISLVPCSSELISFDSDTLRRR